MFKLKPEMKGQLKMVLFLTQEGEFNVAYRKMLTIKDEVIKRMKKVFVAVAYVNVFRCLVPCIKILCLGECVHPHLFFF